MQKTKINPDIAFCCQLPKLEPREMHSPEIKLNIGRLDDHDGKPRNFSLVSHWDTAKGSFGGSYSRIYASGCDFYRAGSLDANAFSYYGPDIAYGDMNEYRHGLRVLERISKNMDKIHATRGSALDAAEQVGRWLEACEVSRVFIGQPSPDRPCGYSSLRELGYFS